MLSFVRVRTFVVLVVASFFFVAADDPHVSPKKQWSWKIALQEDHHQ
jgi:hypothetical protein